MHTAVRKQDYEFGTRCSCGRRHRAPGTPEEMSLSDAMSRCNLADNRRCRQVKQSGTRRPATRPHQREGAGNQNCERSASHTQINTNKSNTRTVFATRRPHPQGHLSSGRYPCARPKEVPVHPEIVLQLVGGVGLPVINVVPWRRRLQYGEQPRKLTQSIHVRQHIKIMRFSLADPKSRKISTRRLAAFTSSRSLWA